MHRDSGVRIQILQSFQNANWKYETKASQCHLFFISVSRIFYSLKISHLSFFFSISFFLPLSIFLFHFISFYLPRLLCILTSKLLLSLSFLPYFTISPSSNIKIMQEQCENVWKKLHENTCSHLIADLAHHHPYLVWKFCGGY